jgi:hypothetical protein
VSSLIVHPGADLPYASFILEGLATLLGPSAITYSTEGFDRKYRGGRVLAFYRADDPRARCFVSLHDHSKVNPMGLHWGSVYGMVNVRVEDVGREGKVVPIGPTFGVRLRSRSITVRHVLHAARWRGARGWRATAADGREVAQYLRRRTTIDRYVPHESDKDYVFFAAWPWVKHPEVNPPRARFIEACRRAPGLSFEGGFAPRRRNELPELVRLSAPRRYSIGEYLDKVGHSAVAFNNPAVHGCQGWKLGEYLALGKAIISLPLSLALPAELEHGVHLHIVDGSPASLDHALDRLRCDDAYRTQLQVNARQWYEAHLAPTQLARRLLSLMDRPSVDV